MTGKWQSQPKLWRIRAKASDGLVVTLGRYETEAAAQADMERLQRDGEYRHLKLEPIAPPPAPNPAQP